MTYGRRGEGTSVDGFVRGRQRSIGSLVWVSVVHSRQQPPQSESLSHRRPQSHNLVTYRISFVDLRHLLLRPTNLRRAPTHLLLDRSTCARYN